MTASIIYVSSSQESPSFERKILEDLLRKCGDLKIVAVTQKPIELRADSINNIVVGQKGASGYNFCRQVLIACEHSDTQIVISAEADCLYSADYFLFRPQRLDIPYRNTNIYVQKYKQNYFCKKSMSTFSQVVGREFYIERLKELFKGIPEWSVDYKNFPKEIHKSLFDEFKTFETKFPCISFKTGRGMRKHSNSDEIPVYTLPGWGSTEELRKEYL